MTREITPDSYEEGTDAREFVQEILSSGVLDDLNDGLGFDADAVGDEAGNGIEEYNGYSWYVGPAVRANSDADLVLLIRATTVDVKWDGLGQGYIVYPARGSKMQEGE